MAGFREFQTGEVLTAANVNDFLSKQAVMKFADSAARDTALGTAVGGSNALREGMVAYLDSTDAVQVYNGTAWAGLANAGIGTNVASTAKTDFYSMTSNTYQDITGFSVSITPSSATSKVLVIASIAVSNSTNFSDATEVQLVRDSTDIFLGTGGASTNQTEFHVGSTSAINRYTAVFLDSPATTSATTYKMKMRATGTSTGYLNRRQADANPGVASSITVIEVAA